MLFAISLYDGLDCGGGGGLEFSKKLAHYSLSLKFWLIL